MSTDRQLRVYNSLTNTAEPLVKRDLTWYTCGPTVYDDSHLGHARNYVSNDILRRIMKHFGYSVTFAMNITNIDDKIIQRAQIHKTDWKSIADKFEAAFWKDMKSLNVDLPDMITHVSNYMPEIIEFIAKIIENGYAYCVDESVYFDTVKYYETFKDNFVLHPWNI